MTTDAGGELTKLRQIAYGRTAGVDEERAAADALRRLHAMKSAAVAEPVEAPMSHTAPSTSSGNAPVAEPVEAPLTRKPWFWVALAAAMVACFGLGFVASALLQGPSGTRDVPPTDGVSQGDEPLHTATPEEKAEAEARLGAALAQFARAQSEADRSYDPATIATLQYAPETVRIVGSTEQGSVFAARNSANDICLIATTADDGWASSCIPESEFGPNSGIGIGVNSLVIFWDGFNVTSEQVLD